MSELAIRILRTLYPSGYTTRDRIIKYLNVTAQEFDEAYQFLYEKHFIYRVEPDSFHISALGSNEVEYKIGKE